MQVQILNWKNKKPHSSKNHHFKEFQVIKYSNKYCSSQKLSGHCTGSQEGKRQRNARTSYVVFVAF